MRYFVNLLKAPVTKRNLSPHPLASHASTGWSRYDLKINTTTFTQQRRSTHRLLAPTRCNHGSTTTLRSPFQKNAWRGFSANPSSGARKFGGFILKMSLTGGLLYVLWVGASFALAIWHGLNPPLLAGWPNEVREYLFEARIGIWLGIKDDILDNLQKAWTAVQNVPIELLNPDPSVKMLSVAIWFSDQLEKAGQARRAYKVLCDAVDLYHSRFRMCSPPREFPKPGTVMISAHTHLTRKVENGPANTLSSVNTEEMRYLISVLTKLAKLAETYEPTAEGKWLSHALHEAIPLLSLYQDVPKEKIYDVLTRAEDLATVDSCLSGISLLVNSGLNQSDSSAETRKMEDDSSPNHDIPEDEITLEDECLFLPFWCPSDLMSAIAIAIEYLGVYAGKHGNSNIAIDAFYVALLLLSRVYISAAPDHDAKLVGWEVYVRVIEILNHETELFLRMLESARYPSVWMDYLKLAANSAARASEFIRKDSLERHNAKTYGRKVYDRNSIGLAVCAVACKHMAFIYEKVGETEAALEYYQLSSKFWESSEHHRRHRGMMDVQEHIRILKQNIAEGKASMEDQMKSMLLKGSQEWSEKESQDVGSGDMNGIKSA
ncbi:hypothetical protein ACEPAI_8024 [Sanghuangporus weigelae]